MREGSGGVIARAVRQLKTAGHALASDAERLQVRAARFFAAGLLGVNTTTESPFIWLFLLYN
jgi:hypothetical protein